MHRPDATMTIIRRRKRWRDNPLDSMVFAVETTSFPNLLRWEPLSAFALLLLAFPNAVIAPE
jgi:hypothetical protein